MKILINLHPQKSERLFDLITISTIERITSKIAIGSEMEKMDHAYIIAIFGAAYLLLGAIAAVSHLLRLGCCPGDEDIEAVPLRNRSEYTKL